MTQTPEPESQGQPGIDFTKPGPGAPQGGFPPPPPGYGPHQGFPAQPGYRPPLSPSDERTWAGAAHWGALVASLIGLAFLGPLLVLLIKGNDSPFVRRQAVESLNFQLTSLIAFIVSVVLIFVLIGILLVLAVGATWLVFTIIGAVEASAGEDYRYPVNIRMVS